eukprot:26530-Pleurochrysis_carterae.AAC.1
MRAQSRAVGAVSSALSSSAAVLATPNRTLTRRRRRCPSHARTYSTSACTNAASLCSTDVVSSTTVTLLCAFNPPIRKTSPAPPPTPPTPPPPPPPPPPAPPPPPPPPPSFARPPCPEWTTAPRTALTRTPSEQRSRSTPPTPLPPECEPHTAAHAHRTVSASMLSSASSLLVPPYSLKLLLRSNIDAPKRSIAPA